MHAFSPLILLALLQEGAALPDPARDLRAPAAPVATEKVWPAPMAGTAGLTLIENGGQWPAHARFVSVQPGRVVRVERGYLPFVTLAVLLMLYKGYHVLLSVRFGERDLDAIDASYFGGVTALRHGVYGVVHIGMALGLGVFAVALWRSLSRARMR